MEIKEWEIWHTYSSYLEVASVDLVSMAEDLVQSGIAICAMHRDGPTFWRDGDNVCSGFTQVNVSADAEEAGISLEFDEASSQQPDGFALEAWGQGSRFRFHECRLFGEHEGLPPPYVRAFLGKCYFFSEDEHRVGLYPVLLVYESGVVIVELRMIGPDYSVELQRFISGAVDLPRYEFKRIEVPPGLAKVATRAWYQSVANWNILDRANLLLLDRGHDRGIDERTEDRSDGDFSFRVVPLSSAQDETHFEQLRSFALTLFSTVAYIVIPSRLLLKKIVTIGRLS